MEGPNWILSSEKTSEDLNMIAFSSYILSSEKTSKDLNSLFSIFVFL